MRVYLLYILTGLITFWIILILLGVSAGFADYIPVVALVGSVLLFTVASPILVLKKRLGLVIGIVSCLLILPFDITFTISLFQDTTFSWGTLFGFVPILLSFLSLFYSIRGFRIEGRMLFKNQKIRLLLFWIPILLFILYFAVYGRYWSWQMFIL